MKALVLGIGLQGRAVVHDLDRCGFEVIAADVDAGAVSKSLEQLGCSKARAVSLDVARGEQLHAFVRDTAPSVVVCMVPPAFQEQVAQAALDAGAHFVSSSYTGPVASLDAQARARGLVMLPEIGLDPGIDLVMAHSVLSEFDEVVGLHMYGGGIPEAGADDNPLRYKVTWTFEGVLGAYKRPAKLLREGVEVSIDGERIFRPENTSTIDVPGLGPLEAYPNGDAVHYASLFGLGPSLRDLGRFALRWPGHCAFWSTVAALGFLRDEPIAVDGVQVPPRKFVARLLEPQLRFADQERDLAILRVRAWGTRRGKPHEVTLDLIDRRDLSTGLYAMNRTVGYSASIGAQMILRGEITAPGVLNPARDIPIEPFFKELRARGMELVRR
ncbi:MAG: saccharopine dehydrogenase NADP-binding domain-containing protein [Deltaproteobacteria bacterium]|nr:saccharopine dehydrogenase NADP-binding domain-containing protein [Deltaproteobacteria bacterium]